MANTQTDELRPMLITAKQLSPGDTVSRYIAGRLVEVGVVETVKKLPAGAWEVMVDPIGQQRRRWMSGANEAVFYVQPIASPVKILTPLPEKGGLGGTRYTMAGAWVFGGIPAAELAMLQHGDSIRDNGGKGMIIYANRCSGCDGLLFGGTVILVEHYCADCLPNIYRARGVDKGQY